MTQTPAPKTLDQLPELVIPDGSVGSQALAPGQYVVKGVEKEVCANDSLVRNEEWFHTPPLTASVIKNLTSVELFTESKDQGWASDPLSGNWTWFELEIKVNGTDATRELSRSQVASWNSHMNVFMSEKFTWSRGRLFTRSDDLLSLLKPGDVISVRSCARFAGWRNHARAGYLVLGLSGKPFERDPIGYPATGVSAPIILACAQDKGEGLMLPVSNNQSDNFEMTKVRGGVELMGRLLADDDDWAVHLHPLRSLPDAGDAASATTSPESYTIYELGNTKIKDTLPAVKRYTLQNYERRNLAGQGGSNIPPKPKIVVLSDAGLRRDSVDIPDNVSNADLCVYQMSAPLFQGKIWNQVSQAPKSFDEYLAEVRKADGGNASNDKVHEGKAEKLLREAEKACLPHRARLVVVIDAEDLRAQGMQLSFRVSWEKTMEDFRAYFRRHMAGSYIEGIHLIVRCSYEGAFYLRLEPGKDKFTFHMVPDMAEGDLLRSRKGLIPGIDTAFLCGLASSLAQQSATSLKCLCSTQFEWAAKCALRWSHRFASIGFRKGSNGQYDYPSADDVNVDTKSDLSINKFYESNMGPDGEWSMFGLLSPLTLQVAARIVKGPSKEIISLFPTAQFGSLLTADRAEIEGFRATAAVVDEYLRGSSSKPLSLAVFGPPGSGKSFGIKQVIKAVTKGQGRGSGEILEVNLSQFTTYSDLVTTFHTIRDMALGGNTPVVLFDEFDSSFQQKLGWLKYLLAPMQDGAFLDGGHSRPLGRAIFVFIGGTSSNFNDFSNYSDEESKSAKKPDFISRLSAYIDIRGPNRLQDNGEETGSQQRAADTMFPIRRALLLRSLLEGRLGVSGQDQIDVDENLLRALLMYPNFKHGARSLDLIVAMSRLSGRQRFVPAALPSENQLRMHVDVQVFKDLMITVEEERRNADVETAIRMLGQADFNDFLIAILMQMMNG